MGIRNLFVCPKCRSPLKFDDLKISCTSNSCGQVFKREGNIYDFSIFDELDEDLRLSINKWDEFYLDELRKSTYKKLYKTYLTNNYDHVFSQLQDEKKIDRNTVFLEIGCGPMFLGRALANKCNLVIGIDFSIEALKTAEKMFEENGIRNYLLVLGDIRKMPFKDETMDLLYGGGVIEHFKDTFGAVKELQRVLKLGGVSFNTVPLLNIGSLTYRQVWGNIPSFPILKQFAEFVHIRILGAKHMRFGYELSFLGSHIWYLHKRAGFKKISIDKFETTLLFEFIPFRPLKEFFIWLASNSPLFWPMVKVIGVK